MATVAGSQIILDYRSPKDAEILAKAIRDGVFHGLTVKGFHSTEATDVLRILWANIVNEGEYNSEENSYNK